MSTAPPSPRHAGRALCLGRWLLVASVAVTLGLLVPLHTLAHLTATAGDLATQQVSHDCRADHHPSHDDRTPDDRHPSHDDCGTCHLAKSLVSDGVPTTAPVIALIPVPAPIVTVEGFALAMHPTGNGERAPPATPLC